MLDPEMCKEFYKSQYCLDLQSAIQKLSVPDISLEMIEPAKMCKVCPEGLPKEMCKAYCQSYGTTKSPVAANKGVFKRLFGSKSATTGSFWSIFN